MSRRRANGGIRALQARYRGFGLCLAIVMAAMAVCTVAMTADSTKDRTISLYNIHSKETLTIQYMKAGKHLPEAMEKINWMLRDWRKDETTRMDPDLVDLLWEIHNELGSAEPIHIISGYRSKGTNEMLRRTVGGQASQSRHILGQAADVHFPDVPIKKLRYSALIRERGGVGYYPTSAIPFVHIDTDRVRAWPRLPRNELALLFPNGRTQHLPDDGEPIGMEDVKRARAANTELAQQIAAYHQERTRPKGGVQVASLSPSLPQLLAPPRLVERPSAFDTRPSDRERAKLAELAAEPPRLLAAPKQVSRKAPGAGSTTSWTGELQVAAADASADSKAMQRLRAAVPVSQDTQFVPAPAYDDEHPEELSYRPFPIAPLLTLTASADDPALARMVHPDFAKTLEFIDQGMSALPMRLRVGPQTAQVMWAQQFKGEAVNFFMLTDPDRSARASSVNNRVVHTQAQ
jgi:uncharacterized protein YcbK (DUF882 family)